MQRRARARGAGEELVVLGARTAGGIGEEEGREEGTSAGMGMLGEKLDEHLGKTVVL